MQADEAGASLKASIAISVTWVDYSERRRYIELASKLLGIWSIRLKSRLRRNSSINFKLG